jgi:peptidoglycan-associated lipoprotein
MRTLHLTFCVAILGALLLVTSGCGKSIQANSGSKSFEPGAKRNGALPPKTVASTNGSRQPAPSSPSMAAAAPTPTPEPMASEPATPIPSLSTLDSGPPPLNGRKSDEQRIPGELLVAKTEPSDTSRRQVEEIQREQLATAAAGLEDVFFGFDSWQISNEGKQTLMLDCSKGNDRRTLR